MTSEGVDHSDGGKTPPENARDLFARLRSWVEANSEQFTRIARFAHRHVILDRSGWLLHHSTPLHLITDEMTHEDVAPILTVYYQENWQEVATAFRKHLLGVEMDDEARAVFEEALIAHGAGLYRSTVRLLFPEIERVAREVLLEGRLKGNASLREVRRAAGGFSVSDLKKLGDEPVLGQLAAMFHQMYELVETPEAIARIAASSIPNRHAALHGLIAYNSLQNSLAALVMAEFMFKAISILKAHPEFWEANR